MFNQFLTRIFVKKRFFRAYQYLYAISLKGMGFLNYHNSYVTGEDYVLRLLSRKSNPLIMDVGAADNFAFVEQILALYPHAEIHAFEPNPESYKKLIKRHKSGHIHIYQFGLGQKSGVLSLYDYRGSSATTHASLYKSVLTGIHNTKPVSRAVKIRTLDRVYKALKLTRPIDFLKIDTEGAELMVLYGSRNLLKLNKIKLIQFEFNVMNVYSRVFLKDFFELLDNYDFYRLLPDGLVSIKSLNPWLYEIFAFHNILAINKKYNIKPWNLL